MAQYLHNTVNPSYSSVWRQREHGTNCDFSHKFLLGFWKLGISWTLYKIAHKLHIYELQTIHKVFNNVIQCVSYHLK